jgi:hypothetical protein
MWMKHIQWPNHGSRPLIVLWITADNTLIVTLSRYLEKPDVNFYYYYYYYYYYSKKILVMTTHYSVKTSHPLGDKPVLLFCSLALRMVPVGIVWVSLMFSVTHKTPSHGYTRKAKATNSVCKDVHLFRRATAVFKQILYQLNAIPNNMLNIVFILELYLNFYIYFSGVPGQYWHLTPPFCFVLFLPV